MNDSTSRKPSLAGLYQKYLETQDASGFVGNVAEVYTCGTLERLASHGDREIRRAAVLAIGYLGDYGSNHVLGCALLDDDRTVRMLAENGIRAAWARAGNAEQRQQLAIVVRLNAGRHYDEAVRRATELLRGDESFAEAWYQRAVAHFHRKRFPDAIRDCHEALEINPYHFLAAVTMGQAYLELGNQVSSLEAFRRALRLNPDLEGVRVQVVRLARLVEDR